MAFRFKSKTKYIFWKKIIELEQATTTKEERDRLRQEIAGLEKKLNPEVKNPSKSSECVYYPTPSKTKPAPSLNRLVAFRVRREDGNGIMPSEARKKNWKMMQLLFKEKPEETVREEVPVQDD